LNGIADDADDTSVGIQREILSRRIPKK
jgi:hypothetical protein